MVMVPIKSLNLDFQPADCLFEETVCEYTERLRSGEELPPVEVYYDGQTYWLYDGYHRVAAVEAAGLEEINAEIILGTYADMEARWREGLELQKRALREWAARSKER